MKIYKGDSGRFYYAQTKENGWFCFTENIPDIDTLTLCPCSFGYEDEEKAWDKAIDGDDNIFNRIARKKNNYDEVSDFIKKYYPDITNDDIARSFFHYPGIMKMVHDIVKESGNEKHVKNSFGVLIYRELYHNAKRYMDLWRNDVKRVKKYISAHDLPMLLYPDYTMVDVFGCDNPTKRKLLHDFHGCWGEELYKVIDEAVSKYTDENDFDLAFYYVKENFKVKRV